MTSTSMHGSREMWAKAVGLALLHLSRQQKRGFFVGLDQESVVRLARIVQTQEGRKHKVDGIKRVSVTLIKDPVWEEIPWE